jgi:CRP/FNR family cyclic AMP-dependent transcriptional regulator
MVSASDLQDILLLQGVPQSILTEMAPQARLVEYSSGAVIFEEGARAQDFYMLKEGKILLEVEIAQDIIISLGSIKRGYSFGWSSLVPDGLHTTYAVAVEPSQVLAISGEVFLEILEREPRWAYLVMKRVFQVFKRRLERRTNQFIRVMRKHPDIQKLLEI